MSTKHESHQAASLHRGLLPATFGRVLSTIRRRWDEHTMLSNLDAMPSGAMKDIGYRTAIDNNPSTRCANKTMAS